MRVKEVKNKKDKLYDRTQLNLHFLHTSQYPNKLQGI